MRPLEAKDFLVHQTAEQAAIENMSLSDLEKRMMYFTETDECPEDPIALNNAFEAEYDTDEYEAKILKLMRHAHKRIKKDNPEAARQWKEAIRELSKGDHYILLLCREGLNHVQIPRTERPPFDSLKLLGTALLVIAAFAGLFFLANHFGIIHPGKGRGFHAPDGVRTSMPLWLQRLLWFLILVGYFYLVIVPWILKKPSPALTSVFSRLFRPRSKRGPRR